MNAYDPITPVRAASVRGQLRFWWRATHAHRFATLDELRNEEARLWGAASRPAQVSLEIRGNGKKPTPRGLDSAPGLAYGTFPLRPQQNANDRTPGTLWNVAGEFVLCLRSAREADRGSIEQAVKAWLLFGGVGGRTRRGFGAVCAPTGDLGDVERFLMELGTGSPVDGVPALVGARWRLSNGSSKSANEALESALSRLQRFRQGPGLGRNPGEGRTPGRSRWPEAEEIRETTKRRLPKHQKLPSPVHKFPRAAFGMPIVFHFKDRDDPPDTELLPIGKERRASPLILRPIRTGSHFHALALVLNEPARQAEPLELRGRNIAEPVRATLDAAEAALIKPLNGNPDPLDAFLNFFANP